MCKDCVTPVYVSSTNQVFNNARKNFWEAKCLEDFESGASAIPPLRHNDIINNEAAIGIQGDAKKG